MSAHHLIVRFPSSSAAARSKQIAKELGIRGSIRPSMTAFQKGVSALLAAGFLTFVGVEVSGFGILIGSAAIVSSFCSGERFLRAIQGNWDMRRLGILLMLISDVLLIVLNLCLILLRYVF